MARQRVDQLLVARGLAATRSQAQDLVARGAISISGRPIRKSSALVPEDAHLAVEAPLRFVSRGGDKLEAALDELGIDVTTSTCIDVGASRGGFTDCLLSRGARRVYAVDVGRDLLAPRLREDPRVVIRENVNARELTRDDFEEPLDFAVVDASFIGIDKLIPALARVLPLGARVLILVKPQFEVGPAEARRSKGVIKDAPVRQRALDLARATVTDAGFEILGGCDSRLPGRGGNVEYFLFARRAR